MSKERDHSDYQLSFRHSLPSCHDSTSQMLESQSSSSTKCHQILKTFPGRERDSRKEGASSLCTDRRRDRRRPAGASRPAPSAAPRAAIGRRAAGTRRHSGGGEGEGKSTEAWRRQSAVDDSACVLAFHISKDDDDMGAVYIVPALSECSVHT